MAVLILSSSKNSNYADAQRYLQYKHQEDTLHSRYSPILDEYGLPQERENYGLRYINAHGQEEDPDHWAGNCVDTNLAHGKNRGKRDRKQMIFVISHPEIDTPLLSKEALLEEGKAFVLANLQGYDALIAAHTDTDNYHVHIAINSVRAVERAEQPWMMRDEDGKVLRCEVMTGGKHQNSPQFRRHCQQWLLDYTRSHGYAQEDNNRVEDQRKQARYEEKHAALKQTILETASRSRSLEELQNKLREEREILLTRRGYTWTLHLPPARKGRRLDSIGLSTEALLGALDISLEQRQQMKIEETIRFEKKKYIQWLRERREKNSRRAEDTVADAALLIARTLPQAEHSRKAGRELLDLIRQTAYLERDLQTELDKLDRLLERWQYYREPTTPEQERDAHGSYLRWCGCQPDREVEFQEVVTQREILSLQIQEAATVREALAESAGQWNRETPIQRFRYHPEWSLTREEQLRQELNAVRANRKKLSRIAYNCQKAADRRIYNQEYLQKAEHFRSLWYAKLQEEKQLKAALRQTRREKSLDSRSQR